MTDEEILWKQFVMTDNKRIDRVVDLYTTFNPHVDLEALKRGGYIQALAEMMEPILDRFDDHSPEVIAYWAKRGMVKEFHGEQTPMSWTEYAAKTGYYWQEPADGAPQNRFKRWNSFVPVSAFDPANKGRKYPVVIMLHGGFNPISIGAFPRRLQNGSGSSSPRLWSWMMCWMKSWRRPSSSIPSMRAGSMRQASPTAALCRTIWAISGRMFLRQLVLAVHRFPTAL